MWADQTDGGGCQMPQATYTVQHALALGQETELGSLRWRSGLCGHVLQVNCGGSTVEAVVASTCNVGSTSCGVDMIRKTWNAATGNEAPGIAQCTVSLSKTNPISGSTPICYIRPYSDSQLYYTSLGVFNTGGRIVKSASVAGLAGKFQSGSGYFDFDPQGKPLFTSNAPVIFTFEDGSNANYQLSDCKKPSGVNIWQ